MHDRRSSAEASPDEEHCRNARQRNKTTHWMIPIRLVATNPYLPTTHPVHYVEVLMTRVPECHGVWSLIDRLRSDKATQMPHQERVPEWPTRLAPDPPPASAEQFPRWALATTVRRWRIRGLLTFGHAPGVIPHGDYGGGCRIMEFIGTGVLCGRPRLRSDPADCRDDGGPLIENSPLHPDIDRDTMLYRTRLAFLPRMQRLEATANDACEPSPFRASAAALKSPNAAQVPSHPLRDVIRGSCAPFRGCSRTTHDYHSGSQRSKIRSLAAIALMRKSMMSPKHSL